MAESSTTPIRDVIGLAVVSATAIALLAALNALPSVLGGEPRTVLRYDSVAEVDSRYQAELWEPHAVVEPFSWPPSRIRVAVGQPDWAQYQFGDADGGRLVACQTVQRADARAVVPAELLPPGELLQEDEAVVAGRPVRVARLLLADGTIVHELWWRWNGRTIMLRLRGTPATLQAIAARALGSAE